MMSKEENQELASLLASMKGKQETEDKNAENLQSGHDFIKIAKGSLAAVIWALLNAVSKICVQALMEKVPHLELNTMRFVISGCFITLIFLIKGLNPKCEMKDFQALMTYCFNANVNTLAMYVPVVYVPLVTFEAFYIASNIISSFLIFGIILWNKSEWIQVNLQ